MRQQFPNLSRVIEGFILHKSASGLSQNTIRNYKNQLKRFQEWTENAPIDDVEETLMMALKKSGLEQARVRHHPMLLTDNGPAYLSKDLARFLKRKNLEHIRGAPYHPMTQGKIERFHRSMKNVVLLQNYYSPAELEKALAQFVEYYNNERYHESLDNLTPADIYFGKFEEVMTRREEIKRKKLRQRRRQNLQLVNV